MKTYNPNFEKLDQSSSDNSFNGFDSVSDFKMNETLEDILNNSFISLKNKSWLLDKSKINQLSFR